MSGGDMRTDMPGDKAPPPRSVTAFDLPLLAELHRAIFTASWDQAWSAESLAQILAMPGACGWLVEQGAIPTGFVLARFTLDEGEILSTGVLPAARRQGHGSRLMLAAIDAARAAGVTRLFLEHAAPNTEAARLYGKLGFVPIGRRPGYYGAGPDRHDALTLGLELSAAKSHYSSEADHAR